MGYFTPNSYKIGICNGLYCLHILGAITSFKATKASIFTIDFEHAQKDTTSISITKNDTKVEGKLVWNEARTSATFEGTGNFALGEYTMTATNGVDTVTAKTTVEAERVEEIKILNEVALTGKNANSRKGIDQDGDGKIDSYAAVDHSAAYIYYDVFNQYGESIRTSTNITWTVSSCDDHSVDTTRGMIAALKNDEAFTYGTLIYVTGVNVKSGKSVTASLTVGMEQAIDKLEVAGFVSKNDKTKIIETLPKDFSKDTYSLLFKSFDQNGNIMEPQKNNVEGSNSTLTFISDNILLLKSEFKDGDLYTINGEEYASVTVQPGMYVDKGGEVNITAISNKTGGKTVKNFVIGANGLLKSLALNTPSSIVADGDIVEIPYIAYDTEGKQVTNYETIARSTNTLNLNANPGTLSVIEKEDGTAKIVWRDDDKYILKTADDNNTVITYNPYKESQDLAKGFNITDEVDRHISLTTVVVGGESNNLLMSVSDMRRPTSIKHVKINDDDNGAIIAGNTAGANVGWDFTYLDQYGVEMPRSSTLAFWEQASNGLGDYKYDVKAYTTDNYLGAYRWATNADGTVKADRKIGEHHIIADNADSRIGFTAQDNVANVETSTVKYTVISSKGGKPFVDAGKTLAVSYSVLPIEKVSNFAITDISKRQAMTTNTIYPNGEKITNATHSAVGDGMTESDPIEFTNEGDSDIAKGIFKVQGSYKGLTVTLPKKYYKVSDDSDIKAIVGVDGNNEKSRVNAASAGAITWDNLYNFNTAKCTRIDTRKSLIINVNDNSPKGSTIKKYITISDERSVIASVTFKRNYAVLNNATISPSMTSFLPELGNKNGGINLKYGYDPGMWCNPDEIYVVVEDQYGSKPQYPYEINYIISDVTENTSELTHLPDSFVINSNNSEKTGATGVEVGDKFKLTATVVDPTVSNFEVSASMTVTVGADLGAFVTSSLGASEQPDATLSSILMYGRNDK